VPQGHLQRAAGPGAVAARPELLGLGASSVARTSRERAQLLAWSRRKRALTYCVNDPPLPVAPQPSETLLVLDGTTGLNMLNQASARGQGGRRRRQKGGNPGPQAHCPALKPVGHPPWRPTPPRPPRPPQAREFNETVGLTGLILTKLDGTARGGAVVSVVDQLGLPVKFVGVGEGIDDLQAFDPGVFASALFPDAGPGGAAAA
jgi:hypothetical protein